jgi:hypothetical protein
VSTRLYLLWVELLCWAGKDTGVTVAVATASAAIQLDILNFMVRPPKKHFLSNIWGRIYKAGIRAQNCKALQNYSN